VSGSSLYRSLLRLYPREFRTDYGDDLVQHFEDLVVDRGARAAWIRTTTDLIVTVPRYRLESTMSEKTSAITLSLTIGVLTLSGVAILLAGLGRYGGLLLLAAAFAVAFSQRSALARAIRTPGSERRRRRLTIAGILAVIFALSVMSYLHDLNDDTISGLSLTAHNAIGAPSMLGAVGFLVAGLLTPRTPPHATTPRSL
jgi:hypothetical protein